MDTVSGCIVLVVVLCSIIAIDSSFLQAFHILYVGQREIVGDKGNTIVH